MQMVNMLRMFLDVDKNGTVSFEEFMLRLSKPLNKHRGKVLNKAWLVMEPNASNDRCGQFCSATEVCRGGTRGQESTGCPP